MQLRRAWSLIMLASPALAALSDGWYFTWQTGASQCQEVAMLIYGGTPPWTLGVVPIGGQPIVWTISGPATPASLTRPATARLAAGTQYVVAMADQKGYNGGSAIVTNPTELQIVGASTNTSCLSSANAVPKEFNFAVSGASTACQSNFNVSWDDAIGKTPYSLTVLPLDTSYAPWDVNLVSSTRTSGSATVSMNMTAGTRFTILMTNGNGWGRGGVGGVYQVAPGTNNNCDSQVKLETGPWPAAAQTTPIPASASSIARITTSSTRASSSVASTLSPSLGSSAASSTPSRSADSSSGGSGSSATDGERRLGAGAIAGIVIGSLIAAALIIGLLFLFLRRRRRDGSGGRDSGSHSPARPYKPGGDIDLADDLGPEPKVEPFGPYGARGANGYASAQFTSAHPPPQAGAVGPQGWGAESTTTAGAAGIGAAGAAAGTYSAYGGAPESVATDPRYAPSEPGPSAEEASSGEHRHSYRPGALTGAAVGAGAGAVAAGAHVLRSNRNSYAETPTTPTNPYPSSPTQGHGDDSPAERLSRPLPPLPYTSPAPESSQKARLSIQNRSPSPIYVRHEDAGEAPRETIDLPPMYQDMRGER